MSTEYQKARVAFEAWYIARQRSKGYGKVLTDSEFVERGPNGRYGTLGLDDALEAWQAARATPSLDVDALMALVDSYGDWCAAWVKGPSYGIDTAKRMAREALRSALMSNAAPEVDMSGRRVEVVQADELDARYGFVTKVARGLALEEAAKACENVEPVTYWFGGQTYDDAGATCRECAAAIRALADPLQGKEAP